MTNKISISTPSAPSVEQSDNGWLAAETNPATVIISYDGRKSGDLITLYWRGDKSGSFTSTYTDAYRFSVPVEYIEPNLSVYVSYSIVPGDSVEGKDVYNSDTLTLQIRHPLTAPTVTESVDGVLNSAVSEATVVIEPYKRMAVGDRIDMYWTGDKSGVYDDFVPISTFSVGEQLSFSVPASEIASNTSVTVRYTVTYVSEVEQDSGVLTLSIKS